MADRNAHGRAARWLLLACTVFGLAMMHTLGHAGMQMGHVAGHAARDGAAVAQAAAEPVCDGDCHGGAMTGWSVCLAVLGGLAIAVLFAALLWLRRRRAAIASFTGAACGAPRSPPAPAAGVLVRSTAVLRI